MKRGFLLATLFTVLLLAYQHYEPTKVPASDIDDLCDIVGYTCIACTNVEGDFDGADYDELVALDNGMIFEFQDYGYSYAYRPEVAVFAKGFKYQGRDVYLYKLLIEDKVYDADRKK